MSTGRTYAEAEAPVFWPPDVKKRLIKDRDAGKDWRQEEKRATEDEMVGWHHQLNGHEFEQTPGDSEGQGTLACFSPWGHNESDMPDILNNKYPSQSGLSYSSLIHPFFLLSKLSLFQFLEHYLFFPNASVCVYYFLCLGYVTSDSFSWKLLPFVNSKLTHHFLLEAFSVSLNLGCCSIGKSRLTPCDPLDYNPPRSFVHDFSDKNTGVGSIFFSRDLPGPGIEPVSPALAGRFFTTEWPEKKVKVKAAQWPVTLRSHVACQAPVHGILQARILEWVDISSSKGSSWPGDQTGVSCTASRFSTMGHQGSHQRCP